LPTVNNTSGTIMSNQAQLQEQLDGINTALRILQVSLNRGDLTPEQTRTVLAQTSQLQSQKSSVESQLRSLGIVTNPPNPQVPSTTTDPLAQAIIRASPSPVPQGTIPTSSSSNVATVPLSQINIATPIAASDVATVDVTSGQERIILPAGQQSPAQDPQANRFVFDENGELVPADSTQAQDILARESRVQNVTPQPISTYSSIFNPETGLWDVYDLQTGQIVLTDRSQQDADLFAQDANTVGVENAQAGDVQRAEDFSTSIQAQTQAKTNNAQLQAALQQQRKQANDGDWRVRLRLAPSANYLYRADNPGPLLQPLKETDGVVFPYTPQIVQAYRADYTATSLTHSNYRGFFYQGSHPEDIQINATFTAQDTREANYLLAVLTFFKSVTKMFYGQDAQRGTPPPMVFLQGLGQYQFNLNPCVVTQFNYTLPSDVDYIRALSPNINGTNQNNLREGRQALPIDPFSSAVSRIKNLLQPQLGTGLSQYNKPAPRTLGTNSPTYVPTKIDISLILHPMQSRQQISQEFSLKDYANGSLIEKGFW
jgi:hypothetical protein